MGRFVSADPYFDHAFGTQGWNRYGYLGNRGTSLHDPTGFEAGCSDCHGGGGSGSGGQGFWASIGNFFSDLFGIGGSHELTEYVPTSPRFDEDGNRWVSDGSGGWLQEVVATPNDFVISAPGFDDPGRWGLDHFDRSIGGIARGLEDRPEAGQPNAGLQPSCEWVDAQTAQEMAIAGAIVAGVTLVALAAPPLLAVPALGGELAFPFGATAVSDIVIGVTFSLGVPGAAAGAAGGAMAGDVLYEMCRG